MAEATVASASYLCKQCGVSFLRRPWTRGPKPQYCGAGCRSRHRLGLAGPKQPLCEIVCPTCHTVFQQRGPRHRYCSTLCKNAGYDRQARRSSSLPWYICKHCEKRYQPSGRDRKGDFCSRACSIAHLVLHGRTRHCRDCGDTYPMGAKDKRCVACHEKAYRTVCAQCGQVFLASRLHAQTCSPLCSREWQRNKKTPITNECTQCHQVFARAKWAQSAVCPFCVAANSKRAKRRAARVNKKRRKALKRAGRLIATERFLDDEIFERDKWRCQQCKKKCSRSYGVNDDLYPNLDHVIPVTMGGPHTRANAQLLCRRCNGLKRDTIPSGTQLRLLG